MNMKSPTNQWYIYHSNFHIWHMHMRENVSPNMYVLNFYLLRHIHETVEALGPLRAYSIRSAERAIGMLFYNFNWHIIKEQIIKLFFSFIGFFKRHVKSRVLPGANAGNIIKRQLLTRNFEWVYQSEEVTEERPEGGTYTIMDCPGIEL